MASQTAQRSAIPRSIKNDDIVCCDEDEYWRDLEIWVTGRSRSLNMTLIDDRLYTTYYWSLIVIIALSCTTFELLYVQ